LEAIDRAMCTLPKQRLQTAEEWLAMYSGNPVALAEPAPGTEAAVQRLVTDFQREDAQTIAVEPVVPAKMASRPQPVAGEAAAPKRKSPLPMLAGGVFALAVAGGVYVLLGGSPDAPTATQAADTATTVQNDASVTETAKVTAPDTVTETAASTKVEPAVESASAPGIAAASITGTSSATKPEPAPEGETASELSAPAEPATVAAAPAPATEPEADTAAATVEPAAEPVTEVASEPETAEVAPVETAVAEATRTEPEAAEPQVAETAAAAPEPVAEAVVAAVGNPAENQVDFAAWDAELPFTADDRLVGGKSAALIVRLSPMMDPDTAGTWLRPGIVVHSINGRPTPSAAALTTAILNAMQVDPDGRARVVADYSGAGGDRETGLLTVDAVRLVSLSNGVTVRTSTVDGVWQTVVTGVSKPEMSSLRQGDVLFRDKATGIPLDGPTSLETILAELVSSKAVQSEFSIVRDSKVDVATMQLVPAGTP
ncbi:MAG: hypothetical protein ACKO2N_19380, partial [Tabrizicola sp.]